MHCYLFFIIFQFKKRFHLYINKLPDQVFDSPNCGICRENYYPDTRLNQLTKKINKCLVLKCGHIFHEKCLTACFKLQQTICPLCRKTYSIPASKKKIVTRAALKAIGVFKYYAIFVVLMPAAVRAVNSLKYSSPFIPEEIMKSVFQNDPVSSILNATVTALAVCCANYIFIKSFITQSRKSQSELDAVRINYIPPKPEK